MANKLPMLEEFEQTKKDPCQCGGNCGCGGNKSVNEAKKYKFKDLAKAWEFVYGEDMEDEYQGFYQEVTGKYKNKVTKQDIAEIWQKVYGEDIEADYDGFYNELKENLNEANKLDSFNEANADGTISDDEDERREELLKRVKEQMQELLASAELDAKDIGGSFRSPGIMADIKKELNNQLKKFR
jgi:translation elongation factor EF-1beta